MKPEHFLYKSDGLYYIPNIPDKCYYYYRDERTQTEEFDHKSYNEALERAKAEAVKVKDFELEVLVPNHHYPTVENTIYTINMEEKIEIYTQYINPCVPEKRCLKGKTSLSDREDWCKRNCELAGMERFARIAEPKKEDDPFKLVEMCNFPEDYAHENGNYINKCHSCGFYFKGHKRRVTCKMCSEFTLEEWKRIAAMKTPEDTKHAHAGCWLQGEMVGYARCMVKWLESAPKKEEETRSIIWNEWLSKVVDGEGYIMPTKFREAQKHFEIKRKPL